MNKLNSTIKFYVVLNYKNSKGERSNWAMFRKEDAELWNEEGEGDGVIEVNSEEIGWMKQAADAACRFNEHACMGTLETGMLADETESYLQEIYYRDLGRKN